MLSIIIPVFNEAKTIGQIVEKIVTLPLEKEIIIVDDGSTDGTDKILSGLTREKVKVIHHTTNRGKGAAVLTGLRYCGGESVIIQDADLEYNPDDYIKLIELLKEQNADIVFGVRFRKEYRGLLIPRLGNRFLTTLFNILYGTHLNDTMTCYKLFKKDVLQNLALESKDFNIEIEITAKAVKKKLNIHELPISYMPRNYSQGKKIRIFDGFKAIAAILKYRFEK
jgi:dolichol-phosphate mannosyltransferase